MIARAATLELRVETLVIVAVLLVRAVAALINAVAYRAWAYAFVVIALELA